MAREQSKVYPPGQTGEGKQTEVEFRRTVIFECEGRKKGPKFLKGRKYTFDDAFAQRWIKRNAAFDTSESPPVEMGDDEEQQRPPVLEKGAASEGATV